MNLLSVVEVAARLGITPRQVQRLIKAGQLPAQQVGRAYVVQAEEVERFQRTPVGRPRKNQSDE